VRCLLQAELEVGFGHVQEMALLGDEVLVDVE
jgi:hypothetical protein